MSRPEQGDGPTMRFLWQPVRIMSLHRSKGLSARLVVIAGVVDGVIPRDPVGTIEVMEIGVVVAYNSDEQLGQVATDDGRVLEFPSAIARASAAGRASASNR